jgi:hypothetical protein
MLRSPAKDRTSKNVGPGPESISCEAQRDLVPARARQHKGLNQASKPAQPTGAAHRTGILKPLTGG